jgi:hypothetical protein
LTDRSERAADSLVPREYLDHRRPAHS